MRERRRYPRIDTDDNVTFWLRERQHNVNATVTNISLGGAFIYSERLLTEGIEFRFEAVFPPGTLSGRWARALCRAKVLRTNNQPVAGKFGAALRFLEVQAE